MQTKGTRLVLAVTPGFNLAATMGFLDPFRVANYLGGPPGFTWTICSQDGGLISASNGVAIQTGRWADIAGAPDIAIVSSSWAPEAAYGTELGAMLRRWSRFGARLIGLDTGGFLLAEAGLLNGHRATVHYEHIDAFTETYPQVEVTENIYEIDRARMTVSGGSATIDLALQVLQSLTNPSVANAVSRYIFHDRLRPEATRQLPEQAEPLGARAPEPLRKAIQAMEDRLEEVAPIPAIAQAAGISQRQMERLFHQYVGKPPSRYYRDIRLDRARGLVVQTDLAIREIALACGFAGAEHFSRAYRDRFGVSARSDRVEGRVPFEFRAWPMHEHGAKR